MRSYSVRIEHIRKIIQLVLGLSALITYFLKWHVVYTNKGFANALGCWGPDCKPVGSSSLFYDKDGTICTGFLHFDSKWWLPLGLLLLILSPAFELIRSVYYPKIWLRFIEFIILILGLYILVVGKVLGHFLDRTGPSFTAEYVFYTCALLLFIITIVGIMFSIVIYFGRDS